MSLETSVCPARVRVRSSTSDSRRENGCTKVIKPKCKSFRLFLTSYSNSGSVVCPDCNEICDVCEPRKRPRADPDELMDDVENTCFQEAGTNGINKFLSTFGLGGLAN